MATHTSPSYERWCAADAKATAAEVAISGAGLAVSKGLRAPASAHEVIAAGILRAQASALLHAVLIELEWLAQPGAVFRLRKLGASLLEPH
jgi:hypothetical protein